MTDLEKKIAELTKAKENCLFCLRHANGLADMHDLEYWAKRVAELRREIMEML